MSDEKATYRRHRAGQRERILEAAEKVFIQQGIDNASIRAIADAAGISRRTLYEYFTDKREIAWAIFEKIVEQWRDELPGRAPGSGFERIQRLVLGMLGQLENGRENLRFIVEINALYSREASAGRMRGLLAPAGSDDPITRLFREGLADGSLRAGLDPHLAAAALLNLINAVLSRFALLGDLLAEEYGLPAPAIYQEICRTYLRGIQPSIPLSQAVQEINHEENEL